MRNLIAALLLLVLTAGLSAQVSTVTVAWDYDDPVDTVKLWTQVVTLDGVAVTGTPNCGPKTGFPQQTTCSLLMPLPPAGPHVFSITATLDDTSSALVVNNWNPAEAPIPGGFRTVITVTVSH